MPDRPKRPCARPGCPALVESGYCPEHARSGTEFGRESSDKRGYDYRWRKFRESYLKQSENVICADCRVQRSTDIHHLKKLKDFPQLKYVLSNLLGLCAKCHSVRTAAGE